MNPVVNAGHNALKHMLEDGNAEPINLPFSFLKDITNCFSDDHIIGSGGFAVVYKGVVRDRVVAVKKLTTFNLEEEKFHKEIECLVKARHKNIVRFLGSCAETKSQTVEFDGKFVMADTRNWLLCFEYVPKGTLHKYITDASHGLEWADRFKIIKGLCEGICYLHTKCILHLDLKPTNILIADHMIPKIADFGLSRCLEEAQTRVITAHQCGTVGYLPIEFFGGTLAFTSDIYSLGIIIVEIVTGEKGYPDDENVVRSWKNRLEGSTQLEQVSVCIKIAQECIKPDPKKRPAARDIIDRLDKITSIVNAEHNALKRMLVDDNAEAMRLPFSLLQDITNYFSDDRIIGNGGSAVVYKGMVGHGMVAIKKLTNTFDLEEKKFHKEVECLVKAKHKNIVRFLGHCTETRGQIADFDGNFVMRDTRNWLLCFEYIPNGTLDKYITDASCGLEWRKRFVIIKGICEGICYLHAQRILHLELKPSNILIADHMIPKIADFGLSRFLDEAQTRDFTSHLIGALGYLAPEFFRGQVSFASDIYSLGVIILEIVTGEKGYPDDESGDPLKEKHQVH